MIDTFPFFKHGTDTNNSLIRSNRIFFSTTQTFTVHILSDVIVAIRRTAFGHYRLIAIWLSPGPFQVQRDNNFNDIFPPRRNNVDWTSSTLCADRALWVSDCVFCLRPPKCVGVLKVKIQMQRETYDCNTRWARLHHPRRCQSPQPNSPETKIRS